MTSPTPPGPIIILEPIGIDDSPRTLIGGIRRDALIGAWGNDTLDGGLGSDRMSGGYGDDLYIVDNSRDVVVEIAPLPRAEALTQVWPPNPELARHPGFDTVRASVSWALPAHVECLELAGKDSINATGNELDNRLTGNVGRNAITGGAGNDILDGKLGADKLRGGEGSDTFAFTSQLGAKNSDQILDFNANEDKIALDDAIFKVPGTEPLSAPAFHFGPTLGDAMFNGPATRPLAASAFQVGSASKALTAEVRIIFDTDDGRLYYDADGLGGARAVEFAQVAKSGMAGVLQADNFVVM